MLRLLFRYCLTVILKQSHCNANNPTPPLQDIISSSIPATIRFHASGTKAKMNGSPNVRTRKQAAVAAEKQNGTPNGRPNGSAISKSSQSTTEQSENIFLFWPNIIGYSRIILALASLYYMPLHPRTCSLLYSISCLLDALDGVAARYYEQSTQFGAVLDMVTDRCTTACLLVFLSSAWPRWALLFQGLISLDLASHYMHMYATLTMAGKGMSHKKVDENRSKLLHLYYTNKVCIHSYVSSVALEYLH